MASIVSRPRRAVDRNTTSPRSLSAGASRLASVPDGIPGATLPTTATAHSWPWWATKMPSTVRPPATGRREGHRAAFVEGRDRMPAQSGERATPGSRIALGHHLDNPPSGREEDSLGRGPAEHRGEECDLALGVDGSDNRERFHAESLERAASWRGLPRGRDPLDARGFRPREERKQEQDEERPSVWRSCLSSWPPRPRRSPCASSSRGACYCRVGATLSCTPDLTHANCRQRCLRSPVRRLVLAREARLLELGVRRLSLDRSATRRAIHLDDARDSTLRPYRGRCQGQAGGGRSCRD
jgi:hypothetical protein